MIVISTGIRPRDELAKQCGLEMGPRGGIAVNNSMQTSDPCVYAIGECAAHAGMTYGLVAPGYEMAETLASVLTGGDKAFTGADMSTKLKLMGVDVASFGQVDLPADKGVPLTFEDRFNGKYKKLIVSPDGKLAAWAASWWAMPRNTARCRFSPRAAPAAVCSPHELIVGKAGGAAVGGGRRWAAGLSSDLFVQQSVTKGAICSAIRDQNLDSVAAVKSCTKAGAGCGGCLPLVTDIFKSELKKAGKTVNNHLCEHFPLARTELFPVVKIKGLKTFADILETVGKGRGAKSASRPSRRSWPACGNEVIVDDKHATLQDTNDRFLANIQRGGRTRSVPRVPGGEITPDKLIVIGQVAKEYGLYTKITGGQRSICSEPRCRTSPRSGRSWSMRGSRAAAAMASR